MKSCHIGICANLKLYGLITSHEYTRFAAVFPHFHLIGLQVLDLLHVDGTPATFTDKLDGIEGVHAAFDKSNSD